MKAIELLKSLCEECIELDRCYVCSGSAILAHGVEKYFGLPLNAGSIKEDAQYFYICGTWDDLSLKDYSADAVVGEDDEEAWYYLYEIEN